MKVKIGDEVIQSNIKLRVRLDYRGETRPAKFFFGGKNTEKVAEEIREQKVAQLRNVPVQGIKIEDIDNTLDVYTVADEINGEEVAYAPVILTVWADTIEDVIRFVMREEFRKVEILEPEQMLVTRQDVERFLFKMNQELHTYRLLWEKKINAR